MIYWTESILILSNNAGYVTYSSGLCCTFSRLIIIMIIVFSECSNVLK